MRVDELVTGLLCELKVTGCPEDSHAWRLVAYLAELVEVEVNPVPCAYSLPRVRRPTLITIPKTWSPERQARALLEEIGHALLCGETPGHLLCDEHGAQRLLRLWQEREESRARAFVLAWRLPAAVLLRRLDEGEEFLADLSGLTAAEVRERTRSFLGV